MIDDPLKGPSGKGGIVSRNPPFDQSRRSISLTVRGFKRRQLPATVRGSVVGRNFDGYCRRIGQLVSRGSVAALKPTQAVLFERCEFNVRDFSHALFEAVESSRDFGYPIHHAVT